MFEIISKATGLLSIIVFIFSMLRYIHYRVVSTDIERSLESNGQRFYRDVTNIVIILFVSIMFLGLLLQWKLPSVNFSEIDSGYLIKGDLKTNSKCVFYDVYNSDDGKIVKHRKIYLQSGKIMSQESGSRVQNFVINERMPNQKLKYNYKFETRDMETGEIKVITEGSIPTDKQLKKSKEYSVIISIVLGVIATVYIIASFYGIFSSYYKNNWEKKAIVELSSGKNYLALKSFHDKILFKLQIDEKYSVTSKYDKFDDVYKILGYDDLINFDFVMESSKFVRRRRLVNRYNSWNSIFIEMPIFLRILMVILTIVEVVLIIIVLNMILSSLIIAFAIIVVILGLNIFLYIRARKFVLDNVSKK